MPPLVFDRASGRLSNATAWERAAVLLLETGARTSAAFEHRGYSIGCRLVAAALPARRDIVVRLNSDAQFVFPLADGYWSLLLDRRWSYEQEIEAFLMSVADVDYSFIDCGANFGFWSVLVSSAPFGRHPVIAIEASATNARRLAANAALNGDRFQVLHRAVTSESGRAAFVHGRKHEALQVSAQAGERDGEPVDTLALDDLVALGHLAPGRRSIIKLDVEGAEIASLMGAKQLLAGETVVICEEHGADREHTVSRFILEQTPCRLFLVDPERGGFTRCADLALLDRLKTNRSTGYNVFATASGFWEQRLLHPA